MNRWKYKQRELSLYNSIIQEDLNRYSGITKEFGGVFLFWGTFSLCPCALRSLLCFGEEQCFRERAPGGERRMLGPVISDTD